MEQNNGMELHYLEEYLAPLTQGVWEVVIPKDSVKPLDISWVRSAINIPSPGTVASYRKGRYHAHETATEWRVHLDRHDPAHHPFMHLFDDAPIILMIADTMATLIGETKRASRPDLPEALEEQKITWKHLIISGFFTIVIGLILITEPLDSYQFLINIFIPLILLGLGTYTLFIAISRPGRTKIAGGGFIAGIGLLFAAFVWAVLPLELWTALIFGVLALWMMISAVLAFRRISHGRGAVPEGPLRVFLTGLVSLMLSVLIILIPDATIGMFTMVLGIILLLAGIFLAITGWRLRRRMIHAC